MSDAPRPPVAVRIVRPYDSLEEFLQHEIETVGKTSVLLIGAHSRPTGVILRFEVALAAGDTILRGEGRVLGHKENAFGDQPALSLRFTRLDRKSKALVDHAAAMREARARGEDPASIPPPPVVPDSEPHLASARMVAAPPSDASPEPHRPSSPPSARSSPPGRASSPPGTPSSPPGRASSPPGRASSPPERASEPPAARTVPPAPEEDTLGAAVAALAGDGADEPLVPSAAPGAVEGDHDTIGPSTATLSGAASDAAKTSAPPPLAPHELDQALTPAIHVPTAPKRTSEAPTPLESDAAATVAPPPVSSGRRFGAHEAPTAEYDKRALPPATEDGAPPTATRGKVLPTPENRDELLGKLRERAAGLSPERVAEILAPRS
ncbi:MAG: hypothetical protein KC657_11710 [Myxococcales bacterium]|nr:hypothetical protein [Myxococcales bacterium]